MRRSLASLLILFFGLGPLTATLQASDESRLPACCRRHGAHHCAMSDAMRSQMAGLASGSTPNFTAPSHCPFYPHGTTATVARIYALAQSAVSLPALFAELHLPATSLAEARISQIRTRAGRGPPCDLFA
jgi:hypothetical protein